MHAALMVKPALNISRFVNESWHEFYLQNTSVLQMTLKDTRWQQRAKSSMGHEKFEAIQTSDTSDSRRLVLNLEF